MTMPLSLTSSRYTGAAARRSLERASVVSSITSCPIQASGILLPSEFEALGLSLSIIASSSDRSPPASVGHLCRRLLSPRHTFRLARTAGRYAYRGVLRIGPGPRKRGPTHAARAVNDSARERAGEPSPQPPASRG